MSYELMAELVLIMHAMFIAFVIIGFILILIGAIRSWAWVRNLWFRLAHLFTIVLVVAESWLGWICPLTEWESRLREAAGDVGYTQSFVSYWLREIIFYDIAPVVFTVLYSVFGILVVLVWVVIPPRRLR